MVQNTEGDDSQDGSASEGPSAEDPQTEEGDTSQQGGLAPADAEDEHEQVLSGTKVWQALDSK
jgi:hypothetical protein